MCCGDDVQAFQKKDYWSRCEFARMDFSLQVHLKSVDVELFSIIEQTENKDRGCSVRFEVCWHIICKL